MRIRRSDGYLNGLKEINKKTELLAAECIEPPMPQIFEFYCTNPVCEFEMPSGWGYYLYATADDGERVHCPHPGEMGRAREVIGEDASQKGIDRRTGFNTDCFCIHCETQVDLGLDRDE